MSSAHGNNGIRTGAPRDIPAAGVPETHGQQHYGQQHYNPFAPDFDPFAEECEERAARSLLPDLSANKPDSAQVAEEVKKPLSKQAEQLNTASSPQAPKSVKDKAARGHLRMAGKLETRCHSMHKYVDHVGWFYYTGTVWRKDPSNSHIQQELIDLLAELRPKSMGNKELQQDIARCQTGGGLEAVLRIARGLHGFVAELGDFDQKPHLLNFRNCTVNLKTRKKQPHNPADMLTTVTRGDFNYKAHSDLWDDFIATIQPDPDTRRYLQKLIGKSVHGEHTEDILVIALGSLASNGKTRFDGAIRNALGDYGQAIRRELLLETTFTHFADNIALLGKRYVSIDETRRTARMDEGKMKSLTGGGNVIGRMMYGKQELSWPPTHTVFLYTNHGPKIIGDDRGSWRRIVVVPFNTVISAEKANTKLGSLLKEQSVVDAILAWIVRGYLLYAKEGLLDRPAAVIHETDKYRNENDELQMFLDECCAFGSDLKDTNANLYAAYCQWSKVNDVDEPLSVQQFGSQLESRDFRKGKTGSRERKGIRLNEKGRRYQENRVPLAVENA